MTKLLGFFLTSVIIFCLTGSHYSQTLSDQEIQQIISNLSDEGLQSDALDKIEIYKILEAISELENQIWNQDCWTMERYLRLLDKLNAPNIYSIALTAIDSSAHCRQNYSFGTSLRIQLKATEILFKHQDYSTTKYVFESLDSNYNSWAIKLLPEIAINVPAYTGLVKSYLFNIAVNDTINPYGPRKRALDYIVKIYKDEAIPVALNMFTTDVDSVYRLGAFKHLCNLNYSPLDSLIKSTISTTPNFPAQIAMADTLLNRYGRPEDYSFIQNYIEAEPLAIAKRLLDSHVLRRFIPHIPEMAVTALTIIETLTSYNDQCNSFGWISGVGTYYEISTMLDDIKSDIQNENWFNAYKGTSDYLMYVEDAYSLGNVTEDGYKFIYYPATYILERLPEQPAPSLVVKLTNSTGSLLTGGSLKYYEAGWKDAEDFGNGIFGVNTEKTTLSLKMTYAFGSQQLNNVIVGADTAVFQTVNTAVKLINSQNGLIVDPSTGQVKYYAGGWRDFGTTVNGIVIKELLPNNYSFRMTYAFGSNDKQQNLNDSSTVVFQTVNTVVQLQDSQGSLMPAPMGDKGAVKYYSGGWRDFGTTVEGAVSKELLPNNYSFRMTYAFGSKDKQQNLNDSSTVVFQTVNTEVQLQDSQGSLMTTPMGDEGTVKYYSGGWRDFGATVNGTVTKELLPNNYSFRMTYAFGSKDKQQNLNDSSTVVFQTVNTEVQLQDSQGSLMPTPMGDEGTVKYYSGGWRDFGTTINGTITKELLPNNYSFRMTYAFGSKDKQQNLNDSTTVVFQTVNAAVQLQDSQGSLMPAPMGDEGTVKYYSGGWRDFGTTINGTITKELLPNNYSFRMTYAFGSNDKQQNLNDNSTIVFQTVNTSVQLKDSQGSLMPAPMGDEGTVKYYSGGWRDFGITTNGTVTKELLPNNYSFRMTYAFGSNDKQQNLNDNSTVVFQTVNTEVQLQDSQGSLMPAPMGDEGTVKYYSGGWRDFGATVNGAVSKELLPNNYSFRMTYAFGSNDKQQNLNDNTTVVFQTVNTSVQLKDSQGSLMPAPMGDEGAVKYYSGGWRNFGTTTNGTVTKELLPNNYSFRMTHEFISNDKSQNIGDNNVVNFSTVLCVVKVIDSQAQSVDGAEVKYYSGGWRQIGLTTNGEITKELLPKSISFRVINNAVQQDKSQDTSVNNIVEFTME